MLLLHVLSIIHSSCTSCDDCWYIFAQMSSNYHAFLSFPISVRKYDCSLGNVAICFPNLSQSINLLHKPLPHYQRFAGLCCRSILIVHFITRLYDWLTGLLNIFRNHFILVRVTGDSESILERDTHWMRCQSISCIHMFISGTMFAGVRKPREKPCGQRRT